MPISSHLELVLTMFGWHVYDIVWQLLVETGIAFIPILSMIVKSVSSSLSSNGYKNAATLSLQQVETGLISIICVMMIAAKPTFEVNYAKPTNTQVCRVAQVSEGKDKFPLLKSFETLTIGNGGLAKIPAIYYLVLTVSGAINDYFIASLPCDINIRELKYQASTLQISDLNTGLMVDRFINECYKDARSRYIAENLVITNNQDINWIGSHYFAENSYKTIYAKNPVPGFDFDPSNQNTADRSYYIEGTIQPEYGYPSCSDWWTDPDVGVRKKLVDSISVDFDDEMTELNMSLEEVEDASIRKMLQNDKTNLGTLDLTNAPSYGGKTNHSLPSDIVQGAFEWVGGSLAAILATFTTDMVVKVAPFIQGLTLFFTYCFLPLILVIGGYQWSTIKTTSIVVFAVKFWTPIWALVTLLDNRLTTALTVREGGGFIDYISASVGFNGILSSLISLTLFIGGPMAFMTMLAWSGEGSASSVNSIAKQGAGAASEAGKGAADLAGSAGGKFGSALMKKK